LSGNDLGRNPITIFNFILSARLICILDFVFAETNPTELPAWLAACWPTTISVAALLLDHIRSRSRNGLAATRQENLKSPAFDNVYSVPVQAA